jgi:hypothetical protein
MKKNFINFLYVFILITLNAHAAKLVSIDDSDLFPTNKLDKVTNYETNIWADKIISNDLDTDQVEVILKRKRNNKWLPVQELPIKASKMHSTSNLGELKIKNCSNSLKSDQLIFEFKNSYQNIKTPKYKTYQLSVPVTCGKKLEVLFEESTPAGQVVGIWQLNQIAVNKFKKQKEISFWDKAFSFIYPARGNYFSFGTVHITNGDHWDIVGHELGHAVYSKARLGGMRGGSHRIDQCYHKTLALSEGWASFFGAWLIIKLDDQDAKFKNMVPRRAPITIEHIPSDVCNGQTNEWRVTGFLWDLIDLNDDGEAIDFQFVKLFKALKNSRSKSAQDIFFQFELSGFSSEKLQRSWDLNF